MVDNIRAPLFAVSPVTGGTPNVRAPLIVASPVTGGDPNVRGPLIVAEAATGGEPNVRAPLVVALPVTAGNPRVRCPLVVVQAVVPITEEQTVALDVYPDLIGLSYTVQKSPQYNTKVVEATSGRDTSSEFMEDPWWNFELVYDYLPDGGPWSENSDVRTLAGFFKSQKGRYKRWLFRDPDDYHVVGQTLGVGDDSILQMTLIAEVFGPPTEPINQVDLSTLAAFASTAVDTGADSINVPSHGLTTGQGPLFVSSDGALPTGLVAATSYWAIALDADNFQLAASLADAQAATPINLTAAGSGNDLLTKGVAIYDNGTLLGPADYSVVLPNQILFAGAPAAGHVITADFDYWFVCRFKIDVLDFDKFMFRLWELQKIEFRSTIPN